MKQFSLFLSWSIVGLAGCGHRAGVAPRDQLVDQFTAVRAKSAQPGDSAPSPYHAHPAKPAPTREQESIEEAEKRSVEVSDPFAGKPPEELPSPPLPEAPPPASKEETVVKPVALPKKDPVVAALECYRENKPAEALRCLDSVDAGTREVLSVFLPLIAKLGQSGKVGDPPRDCGTLLEHIERLARALRPRAALAIEKMYYCRNIEKFGVYEPLPPGHCFRAGTGGHWGEMVQVYVELENCGAVQSGPYHETALALTMMIRDGQGRLIWKQGRETVVERNRSPKRDWHLPCSFYVPPSLPVGDYTLWIVVKDMTGLNGDAVPEHRVAKRSLHFRVRGNGEREARAGESR